MNHEPDETADFSARCIDLVSIDDERSMASVVRSDDGGNEAGVENNKKVLRLAVPLAVRGEQLAKLVSNRWYAAATAGVLELADDLSQDESIQAVGVVNEEGKGIGLIVREDFFNLLGRPFGREVLGKQKITTLAAKAGSFRWDDNLFAVEESIERETREKTIVYYLIFDAAGKFAGLFSTKDVLLHFADITKEDRDLAKRIQSRIVKEYDRITDGGLDFVGASLPAKGVGGDFYTLRKFGEGRWMICVCDVSGKGTAASIVSSVLAGITTSYDFRKGLFGFLKTLNSFLAETFGLEKFVTGVFADFDSRPGTVKIFDLGHSHLFLYHSRLLFKLGGRSENLPLGVSESIDPKGFRLKLNPGDIVLFMSDGFLEQQNVSGKEYSTERLRKILNSADKIDLGGLKVRIFEDFYAFRRGVPQHDDVTLVMFSLTAEN